MTKSKGCTDIKPQVLGVMRSIAKSRTMEELKTNIKSMEANDWWNNPARSKLTEYLKKYWLKITEVLHAIKICC